jgi:hypothetical protein
VIKYKARLVAKGSFLDSVHLLLVVATQEEWEVHHLNVKSAFLNSEIEEEVYVLQPPGIVKDGEEGKVLRMHKA